MTRRPRARRADAHARIADADVPAEVLSRLAEIEPDFARTRKAVAEGRPGRESQERVDMIRQREAAKRAIEGEEARKRTSEILASRRATEATVAAYERVLGKDDILLIGFLFAGMHAARSVGRIRLQLREGMRLGTGFLVSPTMVLTNNHVLASPGEAAPAEIDFEALNIVGQPRSTTVCDFDPDRFFFTSEKLDITIVALAETPKVRAATAGLGWHPMVGQEGKIRIGDPVNIIQYPGGKLKSVVLHNSNLMHLQNEGELHPFCWYTSDTERGSSGAPVFNNRWEVIGVHHRSIPKTDASGNILGTDLKPMTRAEYEANPDAALFWANEGTRTSRIVTALKDWTPPGDAMIELRDGLLALWERSKLRNLGQDEAREGARSEQAASPAQEAAAVPLRLDGGGPTTINLHIHLPPR